MWYENEIIVNDCSKANQRTAKEHYNDYLRSNIRTIWGAYERPSRNKEIAFDECEKLCYFNNGRDIKVISFNTFNFSVGFIFTEKSSGRKCFAYITANYNRYCYID